MKKYQGGGNVDPRVAAFLKKRAASDTTKMYNRGEMLETINAITAGKIKPRVDKPMASGQGTKKYATVNKGDTTYMSKGDFEKKYAQKKAGGKIKKAKSGGSFPDLNKDGKITQADILKGRGVIKNGAALKKQAAIAIAMKKAGKTPKKMMKSGGTLSAPKKDGLSMELGTYTRQIGKNYTGKNVVNKGAKAKMGKSVGKCKYGC